jgi:hypothetical protein
MASFWDILPANYWAATQETLLPTYAPTAREAAAQLSSQRTNKPDAMSMAFELAGGPMLGGIKRPVRAASENLTDLVAANFKHGSVVGDKTMPIGKLTGGVSNSPSELARVKQLKEAMSGPEGYIRRLVVDDTGNVIEGQHRLDALRQMGEKKVPVTVIKDLERGFDTKAMQDAIKSVGGLHPDQVNGIMREALGVLHESKGNPAAAAQYQMGGGFQKYFEAALGAATPSPTKNLPILGME